MWRSTTMLNLTLTGFQQQRSMATLKDISVRLKSITNIQKITKSMKMVAAAKYNRALRELKPAKSYGFYESFRDDEESPKPKHLLVLMASDKGLCGGVHSNIAKEAKKMIETKSNDVDMKMICVGEKVKVSIQKFYGDYILMSGSEIGRLPPTFEDASKLAQSILTSGFEFDHVDILYNQFKSVVSYKTLKLPIPSLQTINGKEQLTLYDSIDDDVLTNYYEFSLASLLFYALKECAVSEQSSRMTAMEGASKNSRDMISRLSLEYNRTRQAVITRELIEIISGASVV